MKKKKKTNKKKSPVSPSENVYIKPDTTPWSDQEFQKSLQDLIQYDWDIRGLHILSLYKNDEMMIFHALQRLKFKLENGKVA